MKSLAKLEEFSGSTSRMNSEQWARSADILSATRRRARSVSGGVSWEGLSSRFALTADRMSALPAPDPLPYSGPSSVGTIAPEACDLMMGGASKR